jgi:uncharacterized protein YxjI
MKKQLTFKKKCWRSIYEVKDGEQIVAKTEKKSIWSHDTNVKIEDTEFFFDVEGIFSDSADIYQGEGNKIGDIDISSWSGRATINLQNEGMFIFEKIDLFSSEWKIFNDKGILMKFEKRWFSSEGNINIYQENDKCLAIGIFLFGLYQQKAAAAAS